MKNFKILALGDVVGSDAVKLLSEKLWSVRREHGIDFVICNAENACPLGGLDSESAKALISAGADILTSGNHIWRRNELHTLLDGDFPLIRPANYPSRNPGRGFAVYPAADNSRVLTVNLAGATFLDPCTPPFETIDRILEREAGGFDYCFVDFHAEATAEKRALGFYLDGRVSGVFGTHTHVATADAQVLPGGTAYITDLGMCGPEQSVLGIPPKVAITRFLTCMPARFETMPGTARASGVIAEFSGGRAVCCTHITFGGTD